jgi:hypothetical protein
MGDGRVGRSDMVAGLSMDSTSTTKVGVQHLPGFVQKYLC